MRVINEVDAAGRLVEKGARRGARLGSSPTVHEKSKYYGVYGNPSKTKWQARFADAGGRQKHIGYFHNQEDAARAVNASIKKHGLESIRKTNKVDAMGRLVAKPGSH